MDENDAVSRFEIYSLQIGFAIIGRIMAYS